MRDNSSYFESKVNYQRCATLQNYQPFLLIIYDVFHSNSQAKEERLVHFEKRTMMTPEKPIEVDANREVSP